jgi:hypothetical protein
MEVAYLIELAGDSWRVLGYVCRRVIRRRRCGLGLL